MANELPGVAEQMATKPGVVSRPVILVHPPTKELTRGTSEAFVDYRIHSSPSPRLYQHRRERCCFKRKKSSETNTWETCANVLRRQNKTACTEGSNHVLCLMDPEAGSPKSSCLRAGSPEAALLHPQMYPLYPRWVLPLCVNGDTILLARVHPKSFVRQQAPL